MFVKKESTSVYRKARSNLNLTDEILQVLNLFWKTIIFFSKSWTEIIREQEARSKNNKKNVLRLCFLFCTCYKGLWLSVLHQIVDL